MLSIFKRTDKAEKLHRLAVELSRKGEFKVGDWLVWKEGLKNRKSPDYDAPRVVTKVLAEPITVQECSPESCYFREPLDVVLGSLDDDGELVEHHYDSRRFTLAG